MTIKMLRLIRRSAVAAIVILAFGIGLVELLPGARQFALDAFAENASEPANSTVALSPGVPIGGPFKLTDQSGADLINHSAFLYLMNPDDKLAALFSQDITADKLAAALRRHVAP